MSQHAEFIEQVDNNIKSIGSDENIQALSRQWSQESSKHGYTYNFSWMGRPIIQYPQDMLGMQELIWNVRPDLIIETGIAHGGSLILSASLLALLDMVDAIESNDVMHPIESTRKVLGIDIDIRKHNKAAIEAHPMSSRIDMIEGSSIDSDIVNEVKNIAINYEKVLVCLDSNHTHDHVLAELKAYSPLVTRGSYCVVFDTLIEDMPADLFPDSNWGPGDNPKTAVWEFLKTHPEFEIDTSIHNKLLITVAPDGYLKRVS